METAPATIRAATRDDRAQWEPLWQGYLEYYKSQLSDSRNDLLWQRIHDCQHPINCLVAENQDSGKLVGLVHYLTHSSSWHERPVCYLEDLFVSPQVRGGGTGEALISAVVDEARQQGWDEVYWHTEDYNARARRLYDKVTGGKDKFIVYRIELFE